MDYDLGVFSGGGSVGHRHRSHDVRRLLYMCHSYLYAMQSSVSLHRNIAQIRVGRGLGPSMGRVGLGHKILRLGWVELGRVQCPQYLLNIQFIRKKPYYSTTIICNDKKS